ncbi:MAG: GGDEF domain-containing protein [Campylobacterota bacterium]|nr:GGDEF domain-containing protein [Campylobacterota bacterium]
MDGHIVGYIEVGKEIDKLISNLSTILESEIYIAVNKEIYKDVPKFVAQRIAKMPQTKDYYIVYQTYDTDPQVLAALQKKKNLPYIHFHGRFFNLKFYSLEDISHQNLGYYIVLKDKSTEQEIMRSAFMMFLVMVIVITLILIFLGIVLSQKKEKEINSLTDKLEKVAILDGLTQLLNRKYFKEQIPAEIAKARRDNKYITMVMADIDYFKKYNDFYGHQAGDEAIKSVALAMKELFKRSGDLVFRLGGEEFAIIFDHEEDANIHIICEQLLDKICNLKIPHVQNSVEKYLTISIGVATHKADDKIDLDQLYYLADNALYEAKHQGRNQIIYSSY